jgi:phosphonate transport system substrate-binding protein
VRKLFGIGILILVSLILLSCEKKSKQVSTISEKVFVGVQPNEGRHDLTLLSQALSTRIGKSVEFVTSSSYEELVKKYTSKEVDFAFFTGLTLIQAEKEAGAKVLLKKVYGKEEFYYSAIVVRQDSKIFSLSDLKGKKFGFVDPKSASGYLYPRLMLRKENLDSGPEPHRGVVIEHSFFGTHDDSVKALIAGTVDAIGTWSLEPEAKKGAWNQGDLVEVGSKTIRVLKYSDPIPNDAFVARVDYYAEHPDLVLKMMDALISLSAEPEGLMKQLLDVEGMATATSRHYDTVRELERLLLNAGQK